MRHLLLPSALVMMLGGCAKEPPPMPTEYIRLKYDLTPGTGTGDAPFLITLPVGSQKCGRDQNPKEIQIVGQRRSVAVRLTLRGAATMPAQITAQTNTMGNVQMDFVVPRELDYDMSAAMTLGFSTADPGNALLCVIRTSGEDLFTSFKATFTCTGSDTANGRFNVSEGEIAAALCPPV